MSLVDSWDLPCISIFTYPSQLKMSLDPHPCPRWFPAIRHESDPRCKNDFFLIISTGLGIRSPIFDEYFCYESHGGWKTIVSFWVSACFQGRTVSCRECNDSCETITTQNWRCFFARMQKPPPGCPHSSIRECLSIFTFNWHPQKASCRYIPSASSAILKASKWDIDGCCWCVIWQFFGTAKNYNSRL